MICEEDWGGMSLECVVNPHQGTGPSPQVWVGEGVQWTLRILEKIPTLR